MVVAAKAPRASEPAPVLTESSNKLPSAVDFVVWFVV